MAEPNETSPISGASETDGLSFESTKEAINAERNEGKAALYDSSGGVYEAEVGDGTDEFGDGEGLCDPFKETETEEALSLSSMDAPRAPLPAEENGRMMVRREMASLLALFPEVRVEELPEEVLASDLPLDAAYALYDRKRTVLMERAERKNAENAAMSAGALGKGSEVYYSPSEVRRMTEKEVRACYADILRSMQKWK